jgi:prepilin-type N-terminal cleavage/methylation domain-containing protein
MKARLDQKAFTLIEVIITIVVAALMGVVIFTYMGNVLTRSSEPVEMVKDLGQAVEIVEEITAKYEEYQNFELTWTEFKAALTNAGIQWSVLEKSGTDFDDAAFDFEVLSVTATINNHSILVLFTELNP